MSENNENNAVGTQEQEAYENARTARMRNIYVGIIFIILALVLILCMIFFFNIKKIEIRGVTLYGDEQILVIGGVQNGQNLIRLDTGAVEDRLESALVYIDEAKVEQKFPSTLVITCTEAEKAVDIEDRGSYYVISSSGRVLEQKNPAPTGRIPVIKGFELKSKELGEELESVDSLKTDILSQLLESIMNLGFNKINYIDMTDRSDIRIMYDDRIEIKLGSSVDIEQKLTAMKLVLEQLSDDYEGTFIYNSANSGVSAIPKERGVEMPPDDSDASSQEETEAQQTDAQWQPETETQWQPETEDYLADNNTETWQADDGGWQAETETQWQPETEWQPDNTETQWQAGDAQTW